MLKTYPKYDNQYEEVKIVKVEGNSKDGFDIQREDGWYFGGIPKGCTIEPKVGMVARFYGRGIGYTVRGLFLDGQEVFYRSEAEQTKEDQRQIKEDEDKKQRELDENLAKRDAQYNALPEVFRQRIDKFRRTNPNFRRDYEPYELFCCEQAVVFANHFKTVEALQAWKELDFEKQIKELPELGHDHSGNTFSCACMLARLYLTQPDMVVKAHGALTPLVGCKEYGCPHDEK